MIIDDCRCCNGHEFKELQDLRDDDEINVDVDEIEVTGEKLTRLSALNLNEADVKKPLASALEVAKAGNRIVLGAEGRGMRALTMQRTDEVMRLGLPSADASAMPSLNVSNAAAIALYELTRSRH